MPFLYFNEIMNFIERVKIRLFCYKKGNTLKVIITGPPRSGTSFLCGLVGRMGFNLGPKSWLKKGDRNNPYGYYECIPLMAIDHCLLKKFGGSVMTPPDLPKNWINLCFEEKKKIKNIVQNGGIEVYKGNMLIILADLYADLFPKAKWIMIHRDEKDTIRSIFNTGNQMSPEELSDTWRRWLAGWERNKLTSNCLIIRYEDFIENPQRMVHIISNHLGVTLTKNQFRKCVSFFKPRQIEIAQ